MQMTDVQRRTFEFRECLGRGGFGEVYLARMTVPSGLSSTVAVKVLHAGLDPRSQGVRRLMDEGRILSMLNHPGIVGVHDLAIIEGRVALVTEFVEGADLGDCMHGDDPIPTGALYEAFAIVADALDAAHKARDTDGNPLGLLHRDVKPGNIRVGRHGQVKLLDFGIATATGMAREAQTGTNALIGSFAYMPPERFRRQPMQPSGDFYSLGCALFECLAGHRLFHLDDMAGLLGPKTDPVTAASFYAERFVLLEGISDPARELIEQLVAVRPETRPSGPEIVARLEDLASETGGPRLARWARAHDWSQIAPPSGGSLTGQVMVEAMGSEELPRVIPDPAGATLDVHDVPVPDPSIPAPALPAPASSAPTPLTPSEPSKPPAPVDQRTTSWDSEQPSGTLDIEDEPDQRRRSPFLFVLPLLGIAIVSALAGSVALGVAGLTFWDGGSSAAVTDPEQPAPEQPAPEPIAPEQPSPEQPSPEQRATEPPSPATEPTPDPDAPEPARPGPAAPTPVSEKVQPDAPRPTSDVPQPAKPEPDDGVAMVLGQGIDRCGPLASLEARATLGTLGEASGCLAQGMRDRGFSQTEREKLGRVVLVDAVERCKKGDCSTYEREQPYFFEEITRSDAEMMFTWAKHQGQRGQHAQAALWADRALERKQQWKGATYVKRVDALLAIRARASYAQWQAAPRDDTLRNQARSDAAAWANYRGQVGRPTNEPMQMCISAAGSEEVCQKRVNDAVAKGRVVFVSEPPGLALTIDGAARGKTPLEVELSFGDHQVKLGDQGASQRTIEVGTSQPKRWTWASGEGRWTSAF